MEIDELMHKIMKNVKPTIGMAGGTAYYVHTEIEDKYGRWNTSWRTRDGYWVIHRGKYHDVYKVR